MAEEWKDIIGYEGLYQVSNFGNVRNRKGKILKAGTYSNGYKFVSLRPIKTQTNWSVHRLVATHFIENPSCKKCVNHKDCDRSNNNVTNLEWCTHSENTLHSREYGSAKYCYIEKPMFIKNDLSGYIKYFETTSSLCKFFGKTKSWIGNKRKQVSFPLLCEGWWIY